MTTEAGQEAVSLSSAILRLQLLDRLAQELAKRGYPRDLVADDLSNPFLMLDSEGTAFDTCTGGIFVGWHMTIVLRSSKTGQVWWYALCQHVIEDCGGDERSHDEAGMPRPVARCSSPQRATRIIDDHVSGRVQLSSVYGPLWLLWQSSAPARLLSRCRTGHRPHRRARKGSVTDEP